MINLGLSSPDVKNKWHYEALQPRDAGTPFFFLHWLGLSRLHLPRKGFRLATCCTRLLGYPAHKGNKTLLHILHKYFLVLLIFPNIPATSLPTVLWPPTASSAVSTGAQNHCTSKALCWPHSSSACSLWSLHLPIWNASAHRRRSGTPCIASAHLCFQQTSHAWAVEWLNLKKMEF